MSRNRWMVALGQVLVVAGCSLLPTVAPELVRDGANHFSDEAEATAEARLRDVYGEHGVLLYVLSEIDGDPPRMLDAPMADAGDRPALAVLIVNDRVGGMGYSDTRVEGGDRFSVPNVVDGMLADGRGDAALEVIVDAYVAWAGSR